VKGAVWLIEFSRTGRDIRPILWLRCAESLGSFRWEEISKSNVFASKDYSGKQQVAGVQCVVNSRSMVGQVSLRREKLAQYRY
jgi:hypothetical protein